MHEKIVILDLHVMVWNPVCNYVVNSHLLRDNRSVKMLVDLVFLFFPMFKPVIPPEKHSITVVLFVSFLLLYNAVFSIIVIPRVVILFF